MAHLLTLVVLLTRRSLDQETSALKTSRRSLCGSCALLLKHKMRRALFRPPTVYGPSRNAAARRGLYPRWFACVPCVRDKKTPLPRADLASSPSADRDDSAEQPVGPPRQPQKSLGRATPGPRADPAVSSSLQSVNITFSPPRSGMRPCDGDGGLSAAGA